MKKSELKDVNLIEDLACQTIYGVEQLSESAFQKFGNGNELTKDESIELLELFGFEFEPETLVSTLSTTNINKNYKLSDHYFDKSLIRAINLNDGENFYFVAKDICDALGLRTDNISRILTSKEISNTYTVGVRIEGVNRGMTLVTESGLYGLIFKSRKPEAVDFRLWITEEVLPSIRKHGGYLTEDTIEKALTDPDTLIMLATTLKDERRKTAIAEAKLQEELNYQIKSDKLYSFIDLASLYRLPDGSTIGRDSLFKLLRDNKILMSSSKATWNKPYRQYYDWFVCKQEVYYETSKNILAPTIKEVGNVTYATELGKAKIAKKFGFEIVTERKYVR